MVIVHGSGCRVLGELTHAFAEEAVSSAIKFMQKNFTGLVITDHDREIVSREVRKTFIDIGESYTAEMEELFWELASFAPIDRTVRDQIRFTAELCKKARAILMEKRG